MPRIDSYTNLTNAQLATDDELVLWDTSAGRVVNAPLSALDARYTPAQSVQMPIYRTGGGYCSYPVGPSQSVQTFAANGDTWFVPFMSPVANTLDRIGIEVTTAGSAGSVNRLGMWADGNGVPGALIADYGTVATDTTGVKELTISQAVQPNVLYWLATAQQGAPATRATIRAAAFQGPIMVANNPTYQPGGYAATGITGAFASSPAIYTFANNATARIFVRFT